MLRRNVDAKSLVPFSTLSLLFFFCFNLTVYFISYYQRSIVTRYFSSKDRNESDRFEKRCIFCFEKIVIFSIDWLHRTFKMYIIISTYTYARFFFFHSSRKNGTCTLLRLSST